MKWTIGKYNPDTRAVPVSFEHAGVRHRRDVNACHDDGGAYDASATKVRMIDVAAGVEAKINLGLIVNP